MGSLLGTGTEWEGDDRVKARPRKPPEKGWGGGGGGLRWWGVEVNYQINKRTERKKKKISFLFVFLNPKKHTRVLCVFQSSGAV